MHEFSVDVGQWDPAIACTAYAHLCKEFKGDLSIGIWNSTVLFCVDPIKAVQRIDYVCNLARKVDVLFVVEAHG